MTRKSLSGIIFRVFIWIFFLACLAVSLNSFAHSISKIFTLDEALLATRGHMIQVAGMKGPQMALGFEAGRRASNLDNWVMNDGNDMFTDEKGRAQFTNLWTPEQIKGFLELDKKDEKTYQDGMKLFSKWFWNLWD